MNIVIDVREKALYAELLQLSTQENGFKQDMAKHNITLSLESLPIGDVVFQNSNTKQDVCVIERKTIDDFIASMRDSRNKNQAYRLDGSMPHLHNHYKFYLVEGNLMLSKYNHMRRTLQSAMTSILFYKGFSVIKTINVVESAQWILQSAIKLQKESTTRTYFYNKQTSDAVDNDGGGAGDAAVAISEEHAEKQYCNVVKKVKKENVTKNNIGEIMLMQIPHISPHIATTIIQKFGSLAKLIASIQQHGEAELKDIKIPIASGERKIAKNIVQALVSFFND